MMSTFHGNRLHIKMMLMCKRSYLISIIIRHQEIAFELAGNRKKRLVLYL